MGICATAVFVSVFLRLDWLWIFAACRNDGNKYRKCVHTEQFQILIPP